MPAGLSAADSLIYNTLPARAKELFLSFRSAGYTPRECFVKLSCAGY